MQSILTSASKEFLEQTIDRLKPCFFADPARPTSVDKSPKYKHFTLNCVSYSTSLTTRHFSEQPSKLRVRFAEPPAQYVTHSGRAV
ncbi:hypothetical protein TNCV_1147711 [Trichonephila clavipes]|nr:hypothetical protein TNCV_1147711 [Trichonephila clavipes]